MSNILELISVSKQYSGAQAHTVTDIDLAIKENEFISIVGPSGCGKTTLLKLICGLESPSSGKILINNKDVTYLPANKRDINLVFQGYSLYPHMTVFENLSFPLRIKRVKKSKIRQRVNEILSILEIERIKDYFPNQISGGQQQRVAIGRALAKNSKILLMDEPLSNLDPEMRSKLRSELKNLIERLNLTVVYVTHDQTEALTLSDKILFINRGKIQQADTPVKVQDNPNDIIIASFFSHFPFNTFLCEVKDQVCTLLGKKIKLKFEYKKQYILITVKSELCKLYLQNEIPEEYKDENSYIINGKIILIEMISISNTYHIASEDTINPENNSYLIPDQLFSRLNQSLFYVITDKKYRLRRNVKASIVFKEKDIDFFDAFTGKHLI